MAKKNSSKSGFTLIEVILFLAISSAVLVAILAGTSRSLAQQRYNDSVQDLFSFLQSQYSGVIDTQNIFGVGENGTGTGGRSDYAIYGKLLVIQNSTVKVWNVIGKAVDSSEISKYSTTDDAIDNLEMKVIGDNDNPVASYVPQWGGTIEQTVDNNPTEVTVAIIRSPLSGTVYTYKHNTALSISSTCSKLNPQDITICDFIPITPSSTKFSGSFKLASEPINLCVNTEDKAYGDRRRNIRISNTSSINAIRLIPLDDLSGSEGNKCQ
ncbi:type II secretion system protein [Candidatus Saccharibacteria bacterium]|nr:type II secretion system protein [Candidatus Saccharibacteria bacterium]